MEALTSFVLTDSASYPRDLLVDLFNKLFGEGNAVLAISALGKHYAVFTAGRSSVDRGASGISRDSERGGEKREG